MTWLGILLFGCGWAARLLAERRALALTDPARRLAYRKREASFARRAAIRALRWTARLAMAFGLLLMVAGVIADPDPPPRPRPGDGATGPGSVQGQQPR